MPEALNFNLKEISFDIFESLVHGKTKLTVSPHYR